MKKSKMTWRISRTKIFLFLLCMFLASGCETTAQRKEKLINISLYIEHLVRGDEKSGLKLLKQEKDEKYLRVYALFVPKLRSLDDEEYYYPVFLEKRQKRFSTIRELKREGYLGEGIDGMIKFVKNSNDTETKQHMEQLFKELIIKENFDRKNISGFIIASHKWLKKKELKEACIQVRRMLALTGDFVEETGEDGKSIWVRAERDSGDNNRGQGSGVRDQ